VRGPIRLKADWEIEADAAEDAPDVIASADVQPAGAGGGSGEAQFEPSDTLPPGDFFAEPGSYEPEDDGH
jgi:hypothetical protein